MRDVYAQSILGPLSLLFWGGRVRAVASMTNAKKTFQLADFLYIGYDYIYLIPNYLSVYKKSPASIVFLRCKQATLYC